jgi:hypothetical protein
MAFPTGWTNYWQATPTNPIESLTGCPVFVSLTMLTGLGAIAKADGSDIRVTDTGNNQLACDLMPWYSAGSGILYMNLGIKTASNQPVRIWAGNPSATFEQTTGTYGQYATYHTGIRAFYPSGAGQDRTRYQNHSTSSGLLVPGTGTIVPVTGGRTSRYFGLNTAAILPNMATGLGNSATFIYTAYSLNSAPASPDEAGLAHLGAIYAGAASHLPYTNALSYNAFFRGSDNTTVSRVDGIATPTVLNTWRTVTTTTTPGTDGWAMYYDNTRFAVASGLNTVYHDSDLWALGLSIDTSTIYGWNGYFGPARIYNFGVSSGWTRYESLQLNQETFWGAWVGTGVQFSSGGAGPSGTGISITFGNKHYLANNNGGIGGAFKTNVMSFDAGLRTGYTTNNGRTLFNSISGDYSRRFKPEISTTIQTGTNYSIYVFGTGSTPVNLTSFSSKSVVLVNPNGANLNVIPSYVTDGTDGGLYIQTTGLNMNGRWLLYLQLDTWQSDRYRFEIRGN